MLLTAYRDLEVLVAAVNSGAVYRYVQKPWDAAELGIVLKQMTELYATREENRRLQERLEQLNRYLGRELDSRHNYGDIIGRSACLQGVLDTISRVAPTRSTVLVTGESGTGKELAARAIHNRSKRKDGPFVRVNLAALSPTIIESELFGHEKGSFTGAVSQKLGRFELAHNGSLFLDEIGDLPPEIQIKLLRVLQEQEFERVGGSQTVKVDVRMIAATNQDLYALVDDGRFREDLFYRINVFPLHVPPLRDRREDIPELARHFLSRFEGTVGKSFEGWSPGALEVLVSHDWPGNVRELENAIERAMIVADEAKIAADDLAFLGRRTGEGAADEGTPSLPRMLESLERQQLTDAMDKHDGSVSRVARELGLNRTTVYYRLKKYGLS